MVTDIRLDIATEAAECETCPAHNEAMHRLRYQRCPDCGEDVGHNSFTALSGVATAIYRLTIGVGYRQPTFLCPDCLAKLRAVLGVSSGITACNREEGR